MHLCQQQRARLLVRTSFAKAIRVPTRFLPTDKLRVDTERMRRERTCFAFHFPLLDLFARELNIVIWRFPFARPPRPRSVRRAGIGHARGFRLQAHTDRLSIALVD